jgi:predicted dehydrogenase
MGVAVILLMKQVRLGVIGLGNMGSTHAANVAAGKVSRCVLAAVVDADATRCGEFPQARPFGSTRELFRSGEVDAVLIATPHFSHTTIGVEALKSGLHVLVEKPVSVHKADCERLIAAHQNPAQVLGAMLNMRLDPRYRKLREMVRSGALGEVRRVHWITTNWFRTQAYYDSAGWRGTWAGEGGGVLINQAPHQLDMLMWIVGGSPAKVTGFCSLGRYHDIEVEDDVTAYCEFGGGMTAVLAFSTGEMPGTNRVEIAGDRGLLTLAGDNLTFLQNEVSASEFSQSSPSAFEQPGCHRVEIPLETGPGGYHVEVLQNFVDAILDGSPLFASVEEGMRSVELANAILFSSFRRKTVDLPLNGLAYERFLKKLMASSNPAKRSVQSAPPATDFAKSFNRK